tara:strand:+ start:536 stop:1447 length:912 start_codon:yes stop_codon:yes gene_type:complete
MRKLILISILFLTLLPACVTRPSQQDPYGQGLFLLEEAADYEQKSRSMILKSSRLRLEIKQLHINKRKQKTKVEKNKIGLRIADLKKTMANLRREGAALREQASDTKEAALRQFQRGMSHRWQKWVDHTAPVTLNENNENYITSHNTQIASADPKAIMRQAQIREADRVQNSAKYRSLLASIPAEQNAPEDLNISSFQISRNKTMIGHVEVAALPGRSPGVPLNQIHSWRFIVSDTEGDPIDADFKLLGHMPGHVHGLPTQPQVTKKLDEGVYLIEGLKFQMSGWWVIELDSGDDRIRFNIVL